MPPPITLEGPYRRRRHARARALRTVALVVLACLLAVAPHIAAALAALLYG